MTNHVAPPNLRILVVDDDPIDADATATLLREDGREVEVAASAEAAIERFGEGTFAIVVADANLPGSSGLELMRRLRTVAPGTAVVVMTGNASVHSAVQALKDGAVDYLRKPINPEELRHLVAKLMADRPAYLPNKLLSAESKDEQVFEGMLTRSETMRRVFDRITLVAGTDATVLVVGETGTGKELVARAIHNRSHRREGAFVPVHMGAISKDLIESELFGHEKGSFTGAVSSAEGKFGAAKGGTIFLDEISTMSERAQVDLLRVLETFRYTRVGGKVEHVADVRVVCATNSDLLEMSREGKFREDLYYRINIFPIVLPPLRDRLEDIGLLADRFMRAAAERFGRSLRTLSAATVECLAAHRWPGNVRELRNVIEQAVLLTRGEILDVELVGSLLFDREAPVTQMVPIAVGTKVAEAERQLAMRTLQALNGDRVAAALALGIELARLDEILQPTFNLFSNG